jgi:hypothetical protein
MRTWWSRSSSDPTRGETRFFHVEPCFGHSPPPPSVDGRRWYRPVTCGFQPARPARSRRPCAMARNPRLTKRARNRVKAAAASCRSQGCSVRADAHLLRSPRRRPCMTFAGIAPPSRSQATPPHPRALSLRSRLGLRTPPARRSRLCLRHPRARLRMRCPGSGLSAPVLSWPSKSARL